MGDGKQGGKCFHGNTRGEIQAKRGNGDGFFFVEDVHVVSGLVAASGIGAAAANAGIDGGSRVSVFDMGVPAGLQGLAAEYPGGLGGWCFRVCRF